ncbi:MAG: DUF1538 domain-containing protein [Clostridia bacterium]|nr:DUF1538 domain-containing protein [Clostridia bacterium]
MVLAFKEKLKESISSILPIAIIIVILSVAVGIDTYSFVLFLIGSVLLILGLSGFNMGADMSMLVMGEKVGSALTHSRKIWLIALVSFIIGVIVTIAEPDLQILAGYVSDSINNWLLIITVAVGVGIFLMIAMLRIVFRIRLSILLIVFYVIAFLLAFFFVDSSFWAIAFDAGGVTTGPMTVPFIMSLGVGVASIRSDKEGKDDSFGLVALSSTGPVIAVLVLGIITNASNIEYVVTETSTQVGSLQDVCIDFLHGFAEYAQEVGVAIAPIVVFFIVFQIITRSFHKRQIIKIVLGLLITFVGLVLFLAGANVGFAPIGTLIGQELGSLWGGWLLIPVGMIVGYFVVAAEPAVHVLNKQVEKVSAGAIKATAMKMALSISVCCALGLAMLRVITGISIMYILVPGYALALILTFFTPKLFTGIAFDSGGVASGAMVSAFVIPMAIGACTQINGEAAATAIMTDAFGCVAFVALMPLITIQVFGILYKRKTAKIKRTFLTVEDRILTYEVD